MNPQQTTYRRKPPTTPVNAADVAALANVQLDTAKRWTRRPGFPQPAGAAEGTPTFALGEVLDWLCSTGRRDCATADQQLWTRPQICERFGLAEQTLKVYVWRGDFPQPTTRRGRTPLWSEEAIQAWVEQGGRTDGRRKTEATA